MEDHRAGLHLLSSRRKHEEEKPDRVHHGRGRVGVRSPALHPRQRFPAAAAHGGQLQEAPHQPRRRQQYFSQQVCLGISKGRMKNLSVAFKGSFILKRRGVINSPV